MFHRLIDIRTIDFKIKTMFQRRLNHSRDKLMLTQSPLIF